MARNIVCVLSPEEIEDWNVRKIKPRCCDHHHVSKVDAAEMTGRGDWQPYHEPIAEIVGGNCIRLLKTFSIHGLSCKVGAELVKALHKHATRDWARSMLEQIQKRIAVPTPCTPTLDQI